MHRRHFLFVPLVLLFLFTLTANADTTYIHVASYDAQVSGTFYTHGTPLQINFDVGLCISTCSSGGSRTYNETSFSDSLDLASGFHTYTIDASAMRDQYNYLAETYDQRPLLTFEWAPTNIVYAVCGSTFSCMMISHQGVSFGNHTYPANYDYLVLTIGPIFASYVGSATVYDGVPEQGAPLVNADIWHFGDFAVHIDEYQAVPEPSTLLLLSSGLLAALRLKRRAI